VEGRNSRANPLPRERGSRNCGMPQGDADRPCSLARQDECRLRPGGIASSVRPSGRASSAGGRDVAGRGLRRQRSPCNGSRRYTCRMEPARHPRATKQRGSPLQSSRPNVSRHTFISASFGNLDRGSPRGRGRAPVGARRCGRGLSQNHRPRADEACFHGAVPACVRGSQGNRRQRGAGSYFLPLGSVVWMARLGA
jgi:hypothetical protein